MQDSVIKKCIDLDKENMGEEFLDGRGNPISWNSLPRLMKDAIDNGAFLRTSFEGDKLDSYIFYNIKNGEAFVMSIQIKNPGRNIRGLKSILKCIKEDLERFTVKKVKTVVDKKNHKSIRFHEKLGFSVFEERKTSLCFEINSLELLSNINQYFR